jgi:hypothetical protein
MLVTIKHADVKKAGVQNPSSCAVAQALCRDAAVAEARVYISRTYVRPKGAKEWKRYRTPANLRTEIVAFDKGAPKAFADENTFELLATPKTGKQQGSTKNQNVKRGPKEHRTYILTHIRPNANTEFEHNGHGKKK